MTARSLLKRLTQKVDYANLSLVVGGLSQSAAMGQREARVLDRPRTQQQERLRRHGRQRIREGR